MGRELVPSKLVFSLAFFTVFLGLGCPAGQSALRHDVVKLPHYSLSPPEGGAWSEAQSAEQGSAVFTARDGAVVYRITLGENYLRSGPEGRKPSAREVADDYREGEKNNMVNKGVWTGMYELTDVTMGQEEIAGKTFYTMKYATKSKSHCESARLFLLFPGDDGTEHFLVAHYSEIAPSCDKLARSLESDFLGVLRSVSYTAKR